MNSLWNDAEAQAHAGALAQRAYSSRLLGREPALVLHGGGNTSVKVRQPDLYGQDEDILYVKGSGWDLATIEAAGFTPLRLAPTARLATLPALSDVAMARALRSYSIDPGAPAPSVEAILHAILPHTFVDHTHADAIVTLTNTPDGERRIRELYGDAVLVVPYVMPGFALAKQCAAQWQAEATQHTIGLVLMHHGIFAVGETAQQAYARMIDLVTQAEREIERLGVWHIDLPRPKSAGRAARAELAALRGDVSQAAGAPMILATHREPRALAFAQRDDVAALAGRGPATPDHVLRTKRAPMIGRDVRAYAAGYQAYFDAHARPELKRLDPAPRVVLDPELGMITVGRTPADARIAADIYAHTIDIILRAEALGGWHALPADDIFQVEYWDLEQAKLSKPDPSKPFTGEVALVTGAASGIGKACVQSLLARGAAVVGVDLNDAVREQFPAPGYLGITGDLTSAEVVRETLEGTALAFGGLDMLVLNAGIFPASQKVAALELGTWDRVMRINLDANLTLLREAHPLLKLAPRHGRVVVIGSKNVPAPGPGAAAYSASKAALTQLARVTALEWGADGIRVNVIHPNAVFDTGIWTDEILASRAKSYGLTVDDYKRNNVLRVEVTSRDVAEMVAEMCGPVFAKTTGAQVPIDGGNDRVI